MNNLSYLLVFGALFSCSVSSEKTEPEQTDPDFKASQKFNEYWYQDGAEISSYKLTQARYGQLREGTAVMVFVTEPFDPKKFVKPDHKEQSDVEVLKLNLTKKFITGIYPYSMMSSSFYPLNGVAHGLKVSASTQEWCGNTFMQLYRKKRYEVQLHSYFESEGEQEFDMPLCALEDDLFTQIRLNPDAIPVGEEKMCPSFFYIRLKHIETRAYNAIVNRETTDSLSVLSVNYPELERTVRIGYETAFPHRIAFWEETYDDSFDHSGKILTTKAERIHTIRSRYWEHNAVKDSTLRLELGL